MLVVDGGASMRCALLGDNIAEMAYKNGWTVSVAGNSPSQLATPQKRAGCTMLHLRS